MKSSAFPTPHVPPYLPGEPLLETERLAALSLQPLDLSPTATDQKLPAVRDALTFLKFTPKEIDTFVTGVSSMVDTVAGVISVIGAVSSVMDLMKTLGVFGPQKDPTMEVLETIGTRITQIYSYLVAQEAKGLYVEAVGWRAAVSNARNVLKDAQVSPTQAALQTLVDRTEALDQALKLMLSPGSANIAFLRSAYGYSDYGSGYHWIPAATPPFMTKADGTPIYYADPAQELQARIWDAGHYIDVLFEALEERILVTVTVEPAFRSTAYNRDLFKDLVSGLTAFIDAWRGAMLVAIPAAGFNGGYPYFGGAGTIPAPGMGVLQSPYQPKALKGYGASAPEGIAIGAVDPVTGMAVWDSQWRGFEAEGTVFNSGIAAWGGVYDVVRAKDPPKALDAAVRKQAQALDQVVAASGIGALVQLRAQFRLAATEVIGSEFVQLPNARFKLVKLGEGLEGAPIYAIRKGEYEQIDLGRLAKYAADPQRKYRGLRYYQETVKTFRFRMARRTSWTRIQLGYRLVIGSTSIPLVPFSGPGFLDHNDSPFPTTPLAIEIREAAQVFSVHQSHVFSSAEENLFEAGEPIPESPTSNSWWEKTPSWRGRLFVDERSGKVALAVNVSFEYDPSGQHYTGDAIVSIRNLDPERFPDGAILPVQVFETHMNGDALPQPAEYLADSMTVHIVPSFLEMDGNYFADYLPIAKYLATTINEINDRFGLEDLVPPRRKPDPDPAWAVRRQELETIALADTLDALNAVRPEAVADVMQDFRPPNLEM